jgi:hypothetical protein
MRKNMTFLALTAMLLVFKSALFSQAPDIPNSGFEDWESFGNYEDPEDWKSINSETVVFGSTLVERTSDAYAGNYAARLETKNVIVTAPAAVNLGYIVETGIFDRDMRGGIPSSVAPESFEGYYKFSPVGNDYGFVACILFKFNDITGLQDTVARAIFTPTSEVNSYTHFKVDMEYVPGMESVQHDTMNVVISSSFKFGSPQVGTTLYVDELKVNYPVVNSTTDLSKPEFKIYPNPTEGDLWIRTSANLAYSCDVVDITGRVVLSEKEIVASEKNIQLDFNSGIYFVKIYHQGEVYVQKVILNK